MVTPKPPPPYHEFPYAKNTSLRTDVDGWKEQPLTMKIFWFGVFQLLSLGLCSVCVAGVVLVQVMRTVGILLFITVCVTVILFTESDKIFGRWLVVLVAHQLDTFWTWIMLKAFSTQETSIVHDGLPFGQDIGLMRAQYNEEGHELFIVYPTKDSRDSWLYCHSDQSIRYSFSSWNLKPLIESEIEVTLRDKAGPANQEHAVVYLHGGGFVAANSAVLLQEAVTMVRGASVTVYALDYPLAPGEPFPAAIKSILDALVWLYKYRNIRKVTMVGDSAGGSLAAYITALMVCPKLFQYFKEVTSEYEGTKSKSRQAEFPDIIGLVSVYGVLDSTSFSNKPLETISSLEWKVALHGLRFCIGCYENKSIIPNHICELLDLHTTAELMEDHSFPPILLVCGTQDPLVKSTQRFAHLICSKTKTNFDTVQLHLFEARHAFIGFPRAWQGPKLRCQAAKADAIIVDFVRKRANPNPERLSTP